MKVILLSGGKGERLRPITNTIPKPMISIMGKPLIEYSIDLFKKFGYKDFIFTLGYLPQVIKNYFGTGVNFGIKAKYVEEDNPLGTAGALYKLKNELKETFIVSSGDILRESDINKIVKYHQSKKSFATIGIYENSSRHPKSIVKLNTYGEILEFIERPKNIAEHPVISNASLYVLEPYILNYIKDNTHTDFGKDIFPKLIKDNNKIYGYLQKGYFLDVGTPQKLTKAIRDIKNNKLRYEK